MGSGHKYEGGVGGYFPVFPPKIMADPIEFKEQPEPTPLTLEVAAAEEKPAEEAKPDADDE